MPIPTKQGDLSYRAIAGEKRAQGNTAGEALDALMAQLSADEASTLIIVQSLRPDHFFTAALQQRLEALMGHWRIMRDQGDTLAADEQAELEALIAAELQATVTDLPQVTPITQKIVAGKGVAIHPIRITSAKPRLEL